MAETKPLLRVRNLRTTFHSHKQLVKAVRGFNIEVAPGEIVAVVGESGSGKSVAMKSIMGLLPPNADIEADVLEYDGRDLLAMKPAARRAMCGGEIAIDLPRRHDRPGPASHGGLPPVRGPQAPSRPQGRGRTRGGPARARSGGHPLAGAAPVPVSPRVLGRHAPARAHRHGAVLPAAR